MKVKHEYPRIINQSINKTKNCPHIMQIRNNVYRLKSTTESK